MPSRSNSPSPTTSPPPDSSGPRRRDLVRVFLRLGLTAFGGPAAHIALMEDAIVRRRGWLSRERFLRLLGVTNLLPGPNSTEMAMHIGQVHGGAAGLVLSGVAFILPAAVISTALAWGYSRFGLTPPVAGLLYGLKPVVVAVVLQALWRLGRTALRTPALLAVGALAVVASLAHLHELIVLVGAGLAHVALRRALPRDGVLTALAPASPIGGASAATTAGLGSAVTAATAGTMAAAPSLASIFLVFLKIGSVLFGSGYVLLMFLRADLVERAHWLTEAQLLDAVAVGQIVPGPVTTTVTFIGYLVAGPWGAVVATIAVFLPAFCFVGLSSRLVPLVERSAAAQAVLDGVVAGSLALMAIVCVELGRAALIDAPTWIVAGLTLVALVRYGLSPAWCVAGAALAGLVLHPGLR